MAPTLRSQSNIKKQIDKTKANSDPSRSRKRKCTKIDDDECGSNFNTQKQSKRMRLDNSAPLLTKKAQIILERLSSDTLKQHGIKITEKAGAEENTKKKTQNVCLEQIKNTTKNSYILRNRPTSNTTVVELRKRTRIENKSAKENSSVANKTSKPKRKTQLVLQERLQNEVPSKEYLPNEIILATIPGYAPWPARIIEIIGQTILVEFFGTGQKNLVRPSSIRHFDIKIVLPLLNRKGYKKAMTELEACLGIPSSLSVIS